LPPLLSKHPVQKDVIFYIKRITGILLLLALSAVFLFSAFTKLIAIEPFEWTFIDLLPIGFTTAAIIARLFIAAEIGLAFFLLAHLFLKKFTYKAALAFLALLTGYLALLIIKQGNTGNCGCFGDTYQMTPLAAIGKNVVMMIAIGILYFIYPVSLEKYQGATAGITGAAAIVLPFIIAPMFFSGKGEVAHQPINLNPIYKYGAPKPTIDLTKGKHIVAYMSLTCPHCRKTAYLLHILHHQHPELPFYMVLNGREKWDKDFFGETKSASVPYSIMRDIPAFSSMAGDYVPAIYWINNSIIERKTYYTQLDPALITEWMKQSGKN
jgi:hypothetical protein